MLQVYLLIMPPCPPDQFSLPTYRFRRLGGGSGGHLRFWVRGRPTGEAAVGRVEREERVRSNKWVLSKSKLAKLRPQHELTVLLSLRESSHARTQHALRAPLLSKLSAAALLSSPHFSSLVSLPVIAQNAGGGRNPAQFSLATLSSYRCRCVMRLAILPSCFTSAALCLDAATASCLCV